MKNTQNCDVRKWAKDAGIYLWQIADRLGYTDVTFSRKLRHELSVAEKARIKNIVAELSTAEMREGASYV